MALLVNVNRQVLCDVPTFQLCNLVTQVSNQSGLVAQPGLLAQQQPNPLSQLVTLPSAQQPPPLPAAAAAAAPAALPQLSVQTTLKLQNTNPPLQPDLTNHLLQSVPHPVTAQPESSLQVSSFAVT